MEIEDKIKSAQRGNDDAFYELINEKKEILYKTAFTYVKNKEDALDIVQETVYKSYISIKKLKEPKYFNTWLVRILINCSIDFMRKNKKNINLNEAISDTSYQHESKEETIDLYSAVDKLKDKYKTVVILKYFQDMTLQEIADVMECPLGTVKTNLHNALKELKLELKEGELNG